MAEPSLFVLTPPYQAFEPLGHFGRLSAWVPSRGAVAVVRADGEDAWTEVRTAINDVADSVPFAPVALWTDGPSGPAVLAMAQRARSAGARAVMVGPVPDGDALRRDLTDIDAFPSQLADWLRRRRPGLSTDLLQCVATVAREALRHRHLRGMLQATGESESTWRDRFERGGIGRPGQWYRVCRLLGIAVTMQAAPSWTVEAVAERYGFYDAAGLRHAIIRTLGIRPAEVRAALGWEWMLRKGLVWLEHRGA